MANQKIAGTENRRTLKKIQDVLSGKVDKDVQSYTINGRQLVKMSITELQRLEAEYTQKCLNETRRSPFGQITVR